MGEGDRREGFGRLLVLVVELVLPNLSGPGVLGECSHEDDDGLVLYTPGRNALAVEGPLKLGVEAFGVLPHPVDPAMPVPGGGYDAQIFAPVEPCGLVGPDRVAAPT